MGISTKILNPAQNLGAVEYWAPVSLFLCGKRFRMSLCVVCFSILAYFIITAASLRSYSNGLQDLPDSMSKTCLNPDDIIEKYKDALFYYSKVRIIHFSATS